MRRFHLLSVLVAIIGLCLPVSLFAAGGGNLDATDHFSRLCTNTDCTTYSRVNWQTTNSTVQVTVTDTGVTGIIWAEEMGWINLAPTSAIALDPTHAGVHNTTGGTLYGYAWGEAGSWINFNPTHGGVFIDPNTGEFSGYAWVSNYGWMLFDCSKAYACVKTTWRGTSGTGTGTTGTGTTTTGVTDAGTTTTGVTDAGTTTTGVTDAGTTTTGVTDAGTTTTGVTDAGTTTTGVTDAGTTTTGVTDAGATTGTTDGGATDGGATTGTGDGGSSGAGSSGTGSGTASTGGSGSSSTTGGGIDILPEPVQEVIIAVTDSIKETTKVVTKTITETSTKVQDAVNTPTGTTVTHTVSTVSAVGTTAVTVTTGLFLNPLAISDLLLIPLRLWSLLLGALGLAKRKKPWGTVYDSVTKQPLDPAYVILRNSEGKDVATAITDLDGRYGFVVPEPGNYVLIANKTNYLFPSQKLVGYDHDELYRDLYFGEHFSIAEAGEVITKNIPMDPEKFDWNEFAKRQQHLMKFYSRKEKWMARISNFFFYTGFTVSSVSVLSSMTRFNIGIFILYVVLFVVRSYGLGARPYGHVVNEETKEPVPYALVRISQAGTGVEVMHRVADAIGRYYCLLPNGDYTVRVDRKLPDSKYETIADKLPVHVKKGYLSAKLLVPNVPLPPITVVATPVAEAK